MRRLFSHLLVSITVFAGLLLTLEIGARVYLRHFASNERFRRYASAEELGRRLVPRFSPHRYLGYYPTPGLERRGNRHNTLGFRGEEIVLPKPPGEFRIVCLGGSTTYTSMLTDYRLSYPHQLQERLRERGFNVSVVNGGVPGWSSWESMISLAFRVLDLDPDLLIIYHGINDVHQRLVWPPSAYRGDNSGARQSVHAAVHQPTLAESSAILRILLVRAGVYEPQTTLDKFYDEEPHTFLAPEFQRQVSSGAYPSGPFADASAEEMFAANEPCFFRRNLEHMQTLAKSDGIGVVLATFASSTAFSDEPRASSPEYVAALRGMNDVVRDAAAEGGSGLFDFAAVFPDDPALYQDGRHMTAEGAELKAELFADYLVREELLNRP